MALLGCSDIDKMSRTLLAMSSSPANCDMMRGSRCIPLLVQVITIFITITIIIITTIIIIIIIIIPTSYNT